MSNKTTSISKESILLEQQYLLDTSESALRNHLTTLYHILDHNGWSDAIFTHCSARLPNEDAYLINPFGLMFNEVNADNIIKVKFNGGIESPCGFPINDNGVVAHTAIYQRRNDVNCIIHTHSPNGVAFSNLNCELKCVDQLNMFLFDQIAYHEFNELFIADNSQNHMLKDLDNKLCMIMRNHGLIALGSNIPMAFWNYYFLERACGAELQLMSTGQEIKNPIHTTKEAVAKQYQIWHQEFEGFPGNADLLFLAEKRRLSTS